MPQVIFSLRDLLGMEVVTAHGCYLGSLNDIVVDNEQSRLGFFLVSTRDTGLDSEQLYAIHHSYFRSDEQSNHMVFDLEYGNAAKRSSLPEFPDHYCASRVGNLLSFEREVLRILTGGGHRSDN